MSELVVDGIDGDCSEISGATLVFAWIARFAEGDSRASFLRKPHFGLPSSLAAAPGSGARVILGAALGAVVTIIERRNSGKVCVRSD
jgi:hypothetical protein